MITVSKATSIEYYTSAAGVAAGMESYYTDAVTDGEPPGVWLGSGAQTLGLVGEVDADDMRTLYSEFFHPHTGQAIGRAPDRRKPSADRIAVAIAAEPNASPERIAEITRSVHRTDRKNVIGWDLTFAAPKSVTVIHTAARRGEIAAQRSGDDRGERVFAWIREQIDAAVTDANTAGIAEAERVATARAASGAGGATRWVGASGLIVASFRQHTSRAIDPHLHQHNVVLNRAICADGKVRALDGRDLIAARFGYSAVSARALVESLHERLGLDFRARPDGSGWEVSLVSEKVMDHFSTRAVQTNAALEPMLAAAAEARGRPLSSQEKAALHREAQRTSRAAKTHDGESGLELDDRWSATVIVETGETLDGIANTMRRVVGDRVPNAQDDHGHHEDAGRAGRAVRWSPQQVIAESVAAAAAKSPTWGRGELLWQLHAHLPVTGIPADEVTPLLHSLADQALASGGVVQVTGRGAGEFAAPNATRYAATDTLQAEQALRAAAVVRGHLALDRAQVTAWLDTHTPGIGADQRAAVEGIAASDAALTVLEGPAGTGKSFAVGALAGAWGDLTNGNGRVFGLAVSRIATSVLRDDGVLLSRNVKAWLDTQTRLETHGPDSTGPEGPDQPWQLRATDVVLIDEASMVATTALTEVRKRVEAAGARLILTGDPHQLTSVEAGGVLGLLDGHAETYTLTEVRRFSEPWERAASLGLRDGTPDALDAYDRHARLLGHDTHEAAIAAAARGAVADRLDGRNVLVVAPTNDTAARISAQIRDQLLDLGLINNGPGAILGRDGNVASVGDIIMCRRHDHTIGVTNRLQYEVLSLTPEPEPTDGSRLADGRKPGWSLVVRPLPRAVTGSSTAAGSASASAEQPDTGSSGPEAAPIVLPPAYAAADAQLAYASTVHAAQGITVDNAHLVAGPGMDSAAVYVAMTRGRTRNTAHVPLTPAADDHTAPGSTTATGGRVSFVDRSEHENARTVLQAILDAAAETDRGLRANDTVAATVAAERDAAHASSMATLTAQVEVLTRHACRSRMERHLDDLVVDGALDPDARARLTADQASEHLSRLLRAVEQIGADPRQVLRDAVFNGRSLSDAASVAQVISYRITHRHTDAALAVPPETTGIPTDIPTPQAEALTALHALAADRAAQLGAEAAEHAPDWAVQALGPVPPADDVADRADWQHRAGTVAAYREAVGFTDPGRALDRMPGLAAPERRAAFAAAWTALGRPEAELTEATMSDGQLVARITAWRREQLWEPPNVDEALRRAETAAETARHAAAVADTRARTAAEAGDHAKAARQKSEADRHRADADYETGIAASLTEAADTRTQWVTHALATRNHHDRAVAEAERRDLDIDHLSDATTGPDWLTAHRTTATEDERRPITENDILDPERDTTAIAAAEPDLDDSTGQPSAAEGPESPGLDGTGPEPLASRSAVTGPDRVVPERRSATEFSQIELDVTLAVAGLAAARLADLASAEDADRASHAEQLTIEAAEAGRRRREAAEFEDGPRGQTAGQTAETDLASVHDA